MLVLLVERYLFVHRLPPALSLPDCHRYGKKKATADELDAHATANGYQRGAHREEDGRRDGNKHGDKTRKDQDATLEAPNLATVKDFLRFCAAKGKGKIFRRLHPCYRHRDKYAMILSRIVSK